MTWGKWRKKPVTIDAVQVTSDNLDALAATESETRRLAVVRHRAGTAENAYLQIRTLEGIMLAYPGDWLIRGVKGELYPCKDDIFRQTYEPVVAGAVR